MTDQEAKKIIVDLAFNEQRIEDSREVEALRKGVIAINEVQAYREIGTVKEFKALKEKSVPKKPKITSRAENAEYMRCPHCNHTTVLYDGMRPSYCPNCCGNLDWEGEEKIWDL